MSSIKEKFFDFVQSEDYEQYLAAPTKNTYQAHLQACYEDFKQSTYISTGKRSKSAGKRSNQFNKVK